MANYRPRSLDELNNLYDKSLEAENVIKKSSSKLENKTEQPESAFLPDEAVFAKKTPEQLASDELAGKVGDFAKNFGKTENSANRPVAIPTVQSRPRVPKKAVEAETVEAQEKKAEPVSAKPRLIRNSERTNLFENYKKVMDDEDDYNFGEDAPAKRRLSRKGKADKKAAKAESTVAPAQDDEPKDQISAKAEQITETVFEGDKKESLNTDVSFAEKDENAVKESSAIKSESEEEKISLDENNSSNIIEEVLVETPVKNAGKQIFLMLMLLVILLSSVAVSSVKVFSGVNTDNAFLGKYYLYTAEKNYSEASVSKGDLVITQDKPLSYNDVFAYKSDNGYSFAQYGPVINEESMIAYSCGEQVLVFSGEVRGAIIKTIPVLGTVLSLLNSYFIPVIGVLLFLAALVILMLFFMSRDDDENETDDEEVNEEKDIYEIADSYESEEDLAEDDEDLSGLFNQE